MMVSVMRCLSDGRVVVEKMSRGSMPVEYRAWTCRPGCVWLSAVGGERYEEMLGVFASFARLGGRHDGERKALPFCIDQCPGSMR